MSEQSKPATGPWRPFSEAPKDGSKILVKEPIGIDIWHWSKWSESWRDNAGREWKGNETTHFALINEVPE